MLRPVAVDVVNAEKSGFRLTAASAFVSVVRERFRFALVPSFKSNAGLAHGVRFAWARVSFPPFFISFTHALPVAQIPFRFGYLHALPASTALFFELDEQAPALSANDALVADLHG